MIALADGLPLLQFQAGEVTRFRRDWLVRSIRRAASMNRFPLAQILTKSES